MPKSAMTSNVIETVPTAHQNSIFSARTRLMIQLPTKRPAIKRLSPPNERTREA